MQIQIDPAIQKEIEKRKLFDKLYKNDLSHFLEGTFREQIFNIKSFLTKDQRKDELLYISVNLSSLIVKSFADFCFWDGLKIELSNYQEEWKEIEENNYLDNVFYGAFINQSKTGYSILRTRKENDEVIIEEIPFDYYYPTISNLALWQEPTEHTIASFYVDEDGNQKANIQNYKLQENWKRLFTAWTWTFDWQTINFEEITLQEELDFLPIIRIDNQKIAGELFGRSDLEEVLDLLEEINDRITQISVQFIKHLNVKIALPESMLEWIERAKEEGKINSIQELDVIWFSQWEQKPEFIENKNMLITDALDYLDKLIKLTASIVQVPTSFFGIEEKGWAEKVEALRIRMMRFLKKVARKQRMFEKGLKDLIKKSLMLQGYNVDNLEIDVKFSDWIPQTLEQKAEIYQNLYLNWLVSKETAIKKIFDRDDLFVKEELAKIEQEDLVNKVVQWQSILPTLNKQ